MDQITNLNLAQLADDITAGVAQPSMFQTQPEYVHSLTLHALADAIRKQVHHD